MQQTLDASDRTFTVEEVRAEHTGPKVCGSLGRSSPTDDPVEEAEGRIVTHRNRRQDGAIATDFASEGSFALAAGILVDIGGSRPGAR